MRRSIVCALCAWMAVTPLVALSSEENLEEETMSVAQKGPIRVVPYNPQWAQMFEAEKQTIEEALGANLLLIEHVGSTSVPGMMAKPKIDIVAVARDRQSAIRALEGAGYTHQGEWNMPLKAAFTKRGPTDVNLHLFFDLNHPEVELNLRFRGYLRTHPEEREAYSKLKMDLLKDPTSHQTLQEFPLYTLRKGPFIESLLRTMGYQRLRVLKANTDDQWEAAKRFRRRAKVEAEPTLEGAEHFVLYRGCDIIGYAEMDMSAPNMPSVKVFEVNDVVDPEEATAFFRGLIRHWQAVQSEDAAG